jgi:hypothetical protein
VAAAVEYVSHAGCLSQKCADDLTRWAFSARWEQAHTQVLADMRANRKELGIPEHAAVPAGAASGISALAYQLDTDPRPGPAGDLTAQVRVVLLCYQGIAGPAISPTNRILVIPVPLHWDGTTFVIVPGDRSYTGLGARPDTPQARANGWHDFIA